MRSYIGKIIEEGGFSLLEILIALSILSISLIAIITAQSAGVGMARDAEKVLIATTLARQKMVEVEMLVDEEGFSEFDREESGNFEDEYPGKFSDFSWNYSIKKIDFTLPSIPEELLSSEGGETHEEGTRSLSDMGIELSAFTDLFSRYVREVKVAVSWGEGEDEQVVLTTHLVNPSGKLAEDEEVVIGEEISSSSVQGGSKTGGKRD